MRKNQALHDFRAELMIVAIKAAMTTMVSNLETEKQFSVGSLSLKH